MNMLFIGNAFAMIGCIIMVAIGLLKKKKQILLAQCVQCLFMGVGNLLLGGISGFICNIVTIARNLVFLKFNNTALLKIFFILLQLVLSLGALKGGIINWFPLITTVIFTWCMDTRSEARLKICILCTQVLWFVYDFTHFNYVASAFDVMTFLSTIIGLYMVCQQKNR